eukprot:CAMPEP_0117038198 /NCGR_PEP_ID=MMETSP0472-20121206/26896_1 /TAXON_ID=693140 ORGANISM="Tiarina fusus, Strain LIS" /NCGR_SAMPLE_ID=MMETSP0472 /ASSEMBLY_ACC=CAM_ASM_000603 /LENGTH=235 /DNA_ID=CAMNT_0004748363 /DNA_START=446 /DNA_END=1150 /DNA_ORIENTATION=+
MTPWLVSGLACLVLLLSNVLWLRLSSSTIATTSSRSPKTIILCTTLWSKEQFVMTSTTAPAAGNNPHSADEDKAEPWMVILQNGDKATCRTVALIDPPPQPPPPAVIVTETNDNSVSAAAETWRRTGHQDDGIPSSVMSVFWSQQQLLLRDHNPGPLLVDLALILFVQRSLVGILAKYHTATTTKKWGWWLLQRLLVRRSNGSRGGILFLRNGRHGHYWLRRSGGSGSGNNRSVL